jgi:hypothetical protein
LIGIVERKGSLSLKEVCNGSSFEESFGLKLEREFESLMKLSKSLRVIKA